MGIFGEHVIVQYANKEELNKKLIHYLKLSNNNDKEAFTMFAELVCKRILSISLKIVNDKMYAEDVLNTVLLKVWQNTEKILKLKNPVGYINTIAYNASIDIKRKKAELPLFDNLAYPSKDHETKIDMEKALSHLDNQEREIVLYQIHARFSFQKIALLLGITKKAVYLRYLKAVKKLKDYLEP